MLKNPPANAGDVRDSGSIPGSERFLGGGYGNQLTWSILTWRIPWTEELGGHSPWDHKELDMTKATSERAMAPHSSTLSWKIPWMEEPGRLQSMGSLRVRHD